MEESTDTAFHSTTYGINSRCPLNRLKYFHVCDFGLPPDVMHDLLEGYVPHTMKLLLNKLLYTEKLFTLEFLNNTINYFNYGNSNSSKPNSLSVKVLSSGDHTLNQSGEYQDSIYTFHVFVYCKPWLLFRQ